MLRLEESRNYKKNHLKLPEHIRILAAEKAAIFQYNPYHASLRTHKLGGKLKDRSSFSVNYEYRIVFKFIDRNTALLLDIGTHKIYR